MITNTQTQFAFAMSDEGPIEEAILHAARRLGYHDLREQQLHSAKKFLQGNAMRSKAICVFDVLSYC